MIRSRVARTGYQLPDSAQIYPPGLVLAAFSKWCGMGRRWGRCRRAGRGRGQVEPANGGAALPEAAAHGLATMGQFVGTIAKAANSQALSVARGGHVIRRQCLSSAWRTGVTSIAGATDGECGTPPTTISSPGVGRNCPRGASPSSSWSIPRQAETAAARLSF